MQPTHPSRLPRLPRPWALAAIYYVILLVFYAHGDFSPKACNKLFGLLAFMLFATALLIGCLVKIIPRRFDAWLPGRAGLGLAGVLATLVHLGFAYASFFRASLAFLFHGTAPLHRTGTWLGLLALALFVLLLVLIHNRRALSGRLRHALPLIGFCALAVAQLHFYLMETEHGVFVIHKLAGRIIFALGLAVLLLRLAVWLRRWIPAPAHRESRLVREDPGEDPNVIPGG